MQEAKEIPSVKVLDPPDIPEKKSFPPRAKITVLCGLLAFILAILWILGSRTWHEADPHDPATAFAQEVVSDVRGQFAQFSVARAAFPGFANRWSRSEKTPRVTRSENPGIFLTKSREMSEAGPNDRTKKLLQIAVDFSGGWS